MSRESRNRSLNADCMLPRPSNRCVADALRHRPHRVLKGKVRPVSTEASKKPTQSWAIPAPRVQEGGHFSWCDKRPSTLTELSFFRLLLFWGLLSSCCESQDFFLTSLSLWIDPKLPRREWSSSSPESRCVILQSSSLSGYIGGKHLDENDCALHLACSSSRNYGGPSCRNPPPS